MTLTERIARKICSENYPVGGARGFPENWCDTPVSDQPDALHFWQLYIGKARAILAEIREPTDAMLAPIRWEHPCDIANIWRAMIDAAMKEEP